MNTVLVESALMFASSYDAKLHLCHAWDFAGESFLRSARFGISAEVLEQLMADERELRQRDVDALVERTGAKSSIVKIHLRKGRPETLISEVIDVEKIDALVIGTVARSRIVGLLIGNTAERLLDKASCAVLAIKPSDFVCPVSLQ